MKKYSKYVLFCFLISSLIVSCYEDKGNYDYKANPEIIVENPQLQQTGKQNANLVVRPIIKNYDPSKLTYKWTLRQCVSSPDIYYGYEIGTSKDLDYKITEAPGDYYLYFEAIDPESNVRGFVNYKLRILSFAQQGLMILHGDDTSCEVSILANNKVTPEWPEEVLQHNVFSTTNGKKVEGVAKSIKYLPMLHYAYIFTDKGGYRTGGNALAPIESYADMFMSPIAQEKIEYQAYDVNGYNEFISNGGEVYWCQQASSSISKKFDISVFGTTYKAAPYIGTKGMVEWYFGAIYDQLSRRFLIIQSGSTLLSASKNYPEGGFDATNVGKDMIYAEHGYNRKWFCVMEDPEATNGIKVRHLYVCNMKGTDNNKIFGEAAYPLGSAEEIYYARYYAFGSRGNVMYYATDKKIYSYDYNGNKVSTTQVSLDELGYTGYEISMVELYKNSYPDFGNLESKTLFVGIYDPAKKAGKLLSFDVNETSGEVLLPTKREYTGFDKIVDIEYKQK